MNKRQAGTSNRCAARPFWMKKPILKNTIFLDLSDMTLLCMTFWTLWLFHYLSHHFSVLYAALLCFFFTEEVVFKSWTCDL